MDQMNLNEPCSMFIAMVSRRLTGCEASPLKTPTATPIDEQAVSRMCACGKELWRDFG